MKKLIGILLSTLGLTSCGSSIPFENQYCISKHYFDQDYLCKDMTFKREAGKTCRQSDPYDSDIDWVIIDIDETVSCMVEL